MWQYFTGVNARVSPVKVADTRCLEEYGDQGHQYYQSHLTVEDLGSKTCKSF